MHEIIAQYVAQLSGETIAQTDWNLQLVESKLIDSINMVELLIFVENEFNVSIPPYEAAEKFISINEIVDVINNKLDLS